MGLAGRMKLHLLLVSMLNEIRVNAPLIHVLRAQVDIPRM